MNNVVFFILSTKWAESCSRWEVGCSGWGFSFLERERTFSLDFQPIGPSVFDGARSKVALHGEGYAVRATRRHRFGGVPTTPRGRDLFLLVIFFG